MREAETMSEAIARLNGLGYTEQFLAENHGFRAVKAGRTYPPEAVVIDEIVRFEGETDLDEEAAIFALRDKTNGIKGTYTVAFGVSMDPADMDLVAKMTAATGSLESF